METKIELGLGVILIRKELRDYEITNNLTKLDKEVKK